jgi:hypothetical protein
MAENGFQQIASGIVPDAVQPYDAQAVAQQKANPFKQIAVGIQPPAPVPYASPDSQSASSAPYSPYSGQETAQPESQEESTEPSYTPPTSTDKPKAKGSLDWIDDAIQSVPGNVQHALQNEGFRQARRAMYGAGLPGEVAKDVAQFGMSAERAGKGVLTHPRASIQPAIAGAASGATGLIENPIALATNLAGGNYNKMVGGEPIQQRVLEGIGQGTEKKFPDIANVGGQAGNLAAGVLSGAALAPAAEALLAEKALPLFNNLLVKAGIKPAIQVLDRVAAQNPSLAYKIARGAATGGVLNAGFAAGGRGAYGQPMQVTGKDVAEGALLGGTGGAFAKEPPRGPTETVQGEVLGKLPYESETAKGQPVPKARRISDVKPSEEPGEPITTTPQMEQPPTTKAIGYNYQNPGMSPWPWQKSYIPAGVAPDAVSPGRKRWVDTVRQAQEGQAPTSEPATSSVPSEPSSRQVGQIVKPPEEVQTPAEAPKRDIAQVVKPTKAPKPFLWENPDLTPQQQFEIAVDQLYNTNSKKTADAAQAFIEQARSGKAPTPVQTQERQPVQSELPQPRTLQSEQPTLGESEKAPEPQLKGRVEETAQAEPPPKSRAQAMYEEAGVPPPQQEASSFDEENPHAQRVRVPIEQLKQRHPETGAYTEPFDVNSNEPREVRWNGRLHGAIPHEDEGYSWVGGVIDRKGGGSKGITRKNNVFGALKRGTSQGQQLGAKRLSDIQKKTNLKQQAKVEAQETPGPQAEAITETAKRHNNILKAAEEEGPEGVAKTAARTAPKEQEATTPLEGDPLLNAEALKGLANDFLEESGSGIVGYPTQAIGAILKTPSKLWNSRFMNEIVKPILSAQTSLDEVKKGAQALNDPLATKLWRNFGGEFIRSWGIKMTGEFGKEARRAMYRESIDDILDPVKHPNWTDPQRKAVAWKKYYRLMSRDLIDDFRDNHSGKISPRLDRMLNDIHRGLISPGERNYAGMNPYDMMVEGLGHAAYHSIFFLNPKTHLQILTHPWQTGSAVTTKGVNPASGALNIANAYRLLGTNKTFQTFMKGATSFTGENRFEATRDFMDKVPYPKISTPLAKIVERDFMSGRLNNEVIGAAGLIKEYGQAKTEQFMHDVITGADWTKNSGLSFDEHADMIGKFLETIHDATGSGTAGVARTLLQSTQSGLGRAVFQLSGYSQQIARFYADRATKMFTGKSFSERANAATQLGVMLGSTALMGGNAIPKVAKDQFDIALIKGSPEAYLALRKAEDLLNLPKQIPHAFAAATGAPDTLSTDMGEHLSNSFINWAGNIGIEGLGAGMRAGGELAGQTLGILPPSEKDSPEVQLRKLVAGAMMGIFTDGIGGQSVNNLWKAGEMIGTGEKTTSLYGANPFKRAGEYPIAKGVQKYTDLLDSISHAIHDVFIPGRGYDESNWAIQNEIADKFKRAGQTIPWEQLQVDYPTTITEAPG